MDTKNTISTILHCLIGIFLLIPVIQAQESENETIDTMIAATSLPEQSPSLEYPRGMARLGQEGWVEISFMVNTQGKVYEPTIVDFSGENAFIEKAEEHLLARTFRPALFNGEPVDSSGSIRYRFEMEQATSSASEQFFRRYKFFSSALNKKNFEESKKYLDRLDKGGAKNLYEDAFLNLAHFHYHLETGSNDNIKVFYLKRAVDGDSQEKYLPENVYRAGIISLFQLQVGTRDYQGALETYDRILELQDNEELVAKLESTIQAIKEMKSDQSAYSLTGALNTFGHWELPLLKPSFSLDEIDGKLEEIKLRCERKYVFFAFIQEQQYLIPKSYGECDIELIGDPETSFTLIQSASIETETTTDK